MASKTDIASQALLRIGQNVINDLDDTSDPTARIAKVFYQDVVREVTRSHGWNCLKSRANLALNTQPPSFGWVSSFTLPTECVRLITVNGYDDSYVQDIYEIEGRNILTDAVECKITYIPYTPDTTKYDPLLVQAIVTLLASRLASKIGKDDRLSQTLLSEYHQVSLPKAQKIDGNEQKRRRYNPSAHSTWVRSRFYNNW